MTIAFNCFSQNNSSKEGNYFLNKLLLAFNSGNIDSINSFIKHNYAATVLEKEGALEKISTSYGTLYDEFGPLELHSTGFDSTYKSSKYFFKGKYTKEWVSILIVLNKKGDKIAGQGIYKLQSPEGVDEAKVHIKKLPQHLNEHLKLLSTNNFFSGSVLIAHKNKIIFNKAYGQKNNKDKLSLDTKMPIASITKLFTGIAISQLIAQGKISANEPISKYIPEYPVDISSQVTIKHLLLHTSGIELDDCKAYMESVSSANSIDELIKLHVIYIDSLNEGRRVNFKPLNQYDYSNEGYHLLGAIIERVTKASFDKFIVNNICIPLGLNNTNFEADTSVTGFSHYDIKSEYQPTKWFNYGNQTSKLKTPSGGIFSTTKDLYQLYNSLDKQKLFNSNWTELLTSDTISIGKNHFYGYGIEGKKFGSYFAYGHNGGTVKGVNAEFRYFPKEDLFIAIICNRGRTASDLLYYITNRIEF